MTRDISPNNLRSILFSFKVNIRELRGVAAKLNEIDRSEFESLSVQFNTIETISNILIEASDLLPKSLLTHFFETVKNLDSRITAGLEEQPHVPPINKHILLMFAEECEKKFIEMDEARGNYFNLSNEKKESINTSEDEIDSLYNSLSFELKSIKEKLENDANQISTLKESFQHEINTLNTKYKEDLAKYEGISQTLTFKETSDEYQRTANSWKTAIVILCIALFGLILTFSFWSWIDFNNIPEKLQSGGMRVLSSRVNSLFYFEIVSKSLLRILIISIVIFLIKFSIKNYNAAKHNMITNLHKANSLATATRLIATSPDTETFNAIITLAAREIFTQPKTGYLQRDNSKVDIGLLNDTISTFAKKG